MNYDWRDDAACRGRPIDWFYPETQDLNERAMEICRDCPVRQECLDYGIKNEEFGIWGGMIASERRRIRKNLGYEIKQVNLDVIPTHNSCGTNAGYTQLLRYYYARPDEERKMCPYCVEAHREYNRRQILDEHYKLKRQEYWRNKKDKRRRRLAIPISSEHEVITSER